MNNVRPSFLFPLLFRDTVFKIPVSTKKMYLTFDDGPTPGVTSEILDLLREYGAKVTFFACGKQAENNRSLLQRILDEGHAVGNHTYSHPNGWKTSTRNYLADTERAQTLLQSRLFRPPYGKLRIGQYRYLRNRYRIVVWDIMCGDFDRNMSGEACFDNIRTRVVPGSIVVFHDSEKAAPNMLYALEQTLSIFGNEGYRFESIPYSFNEIG